MTRVFNGERTWLTPVLRPVESAIYWAGGVDDNKEQNWLAYTVGMLLFHVGGFVIIYAIFRLQGFLPLNPAGMGAVAPDLSFNTAISFITNTNWQNYGGESTLSYLSPDARPRPPELPVGGHRHCARGRADPGLCPAFGQDDRQFLGRYHPLHALHPAADLHRLRAVPCLAGHPADARAPTSRPQRSRARSRPSRSVRSPHRSPSRCLAPTAAASSTPTPAHPFENPTAFSNFIQMLSIFVLGAGLTNVFGRMVGNQRQGWAIFCGNGRAVRRGRCGLLLGRGQRHDPAQPRSGSPAATWKARKLASASSGRRSLP